MAGENSRFEMSIKSSSNCFLLKMLRSSSAWDFFVCSYSNNFSFLISVNCSRIFISISKNNCKLSKSVISLEKSLLCWLRKFQDKSQDFQQGSNLFTYQCYFGHSTPEQCWLRQRKCAITVPFRTLYHWAMLTRGNSERIRAFPTRGVTHAPLNTTSNTLSLSYAVS